MGHRQTQAAIRIHLMDLMDQVAAVDQVESMDKVAATTTKIVVQVVIMVIVVKNPRELNTVHHPMILDQWKCNTEEMMEDTQQGHKQYTTQMDITGLKLQPMEKLQPMKLQLD